MSSIAKTARTAGLLYLMMAILMVFGHMYLPSAFIVTGDASATARNITEGELVYRLGLMTQFVGQVLFVAVVLLLYQLFRDVDRWQARFMVALVCVGVAAELANIAHRYAPLILLGGSDYLSVFTKAQLDAMALSSFRLGASIGRALTIIWGLWLFPFGYLTIKSGYFPRVLGYLLYAAGIAYILNAFFSMVLPGYHAMVSRFLFPLYFAELPIIFWLAIKGAKAPQAEPRFAQAG
jgi:hypothetical protein